MSFPMQYSPHEDLNREYIGKHWSKLQRDAIKKLTNNLGQISSGSQEEFEFVWGKDKEQFLQNISKTKKEIKNRMTERRYENIRQKTKSFRE
jgi:hypothetical protein